MPPRRRKGRLGDPPHPSCGSSELRRSGYNGEYDHFIVEFAPSEPEASAKNGLSSLTLQARNLMDFDNSVRRLEKVNLNNVIFCENSLASSHCQPIMEVSR